VLEEPAEPLAALHLAGRERQDAGLVLVRIGKRAVASRLMRSFLVGMSEVVDEMP
jgi:hypothetical protein